MIFFRLYLKSVISKWCLPRVAGFTLEYKQEFVTLVGSLCLWTPLLSQPHCGPTCLLADLLADPALLQLLNSGDQCGKVVTALHSAQRKYLRGGHSWPLSSEFLYSEIGTVGLSPSIAISPATCVK